MIENKLPVPSERWDDHAVVCPYCGHRHTSSDEYFSNAEEDTEIVCVECDVPFMASRRVSVTYHTTALRGRS